MVQVLSLTLGMAVSVCCAIVFLLYAFLLAVCVCMSSLLVQRQMKKQCQNSKQTVIVCLDVWRACPLCVVSLILQHFAILLKYVIHVAIPDIPGWVAEEMAKLEYRRREAFKV